MRIKTVAAKIYRYQSSLVSEFGMVLRVRAENSFSAVVFVYLKKNNEKNQNMIVTYTFHFPVL